MPNSSLQTPNLAADLSGPENLLTALRELRTTVYQEGQAIFDKWRSHIQRPAFIDSSLNLAYYLALRRHDLRFLQTALMPWGLSSLGRIEARVLPNLDAVIATLAAICQPFDQSLTQRPPLAAFFEGERLLQQHTEDLFGISSSDRRVRIMVTLPTEAASNYELVKDLIQRGCDCMRINCAHDSSSEWLAMIVNIRLAEVETGRACKVLMDLGGSKPRTEGVISPNDQERIFRGDHLLLTREIPTQIHRDYFQASCSIPEVLDQLQVGATVWIDDGHIGARVCAIEPTGVMLQIVHARSKGDKLLADKGLNFPDTELCLSPITDQDRQDLNFIAHHADIVGYSFVQEAGDIALLQQELRVGVARRRHRLPDNIEIPAIIAKIETPKAVRNLPELIVQAAGVQPFGIMIARGDLAVEIGYQRLAEIQEEILWLCEAAHIPVIWATQVLENLVKHGIPSRAEITDVAMAERAECVMLNKGAYIADAVTIVDDVLVRMQAHQMKKTPQLRALHSW
ncbi:pyruvate kinase [Nostoc sp. GT001]|uniref:pyruvate kinase n=1 Tax=Nostoc sp. GT001 TaxID=3056647 RepID=UPI0025AB3E99|nr:pyruvate kinase [Nostoc sp. GT001]MDM9581570.1 pyruvate kinase [Nostoc sp. GT001]